MVYGIQEWRCFYRTQGCSPNVYSKQKPRVCTINHKSRHGTTVLYNAIARRALFGHGLCTWLSDCGAALLHKRERSRALASFPGSPSFRAIIPCMTFDPPQRKAEGEPGRFCHMTRVMIRHPYIRYRHELVSMSSTLCIVGIGLRSETKNLC